MTRSLTPAQRGQLEAALRQRQAELDRQLADHQNGGSRVEMARELLQDETHDSRERDADREVELARADRELAELGRVSQALKRVHEPGYGWCADCGEPIPFERLQAKPWTMRCVGCAAKTEGPGAHPSL
jgi:DnaK suppressor protein